MNQGEIMRKLLLIILLTFASLAYGADGRYTIVYSEITGGVYILDTKDGSVRYCNAFNAQSELECTKPNKDEN
jgi:hypothetical protein